MHFSTENAKFLKSYLVNVVASESDADPQVLADFMYALLQSDAPREVLYARCIEELSVFLEEKTNDIIKRVFLALDDKSYRPKDAQSILVEPHTTITTTTTTTDISSSSQATIASKPDTTASPATPRSVGPAHADDDDNGDDDDDDDNETNFKRRSHKSDVVPRESASTSTDKSHKRVFQTVDGSETGPMMKLSRQLSSSGQYESLHQRLGGYRPTKKRCFDYDNKGYCMRGDTCPYEHGDNPLVLEANDQIMLEHVAKGRHGGGGPIHSRGQGGGRGGTNRSGSNNRQDEVPYTSRYTPYSTKIVVENIPQDHCNMASVTEFFGKFGKLLNLSVQADASRAFLQYASHQEAMAAYQSPAVIFNNRFVKVFWKKVDEEEERKEYIEQQRLTSQPDPEAVKAKAALLAKEKEERQKKQQEHLQKVLEVQKQHQQLMEKQIEEHKRLLGRLSQAPPGSKERESIMSAINQLSTSINANKSPTVTPPPSSSSLSSKPASQPSSQQPVKGLSSLPATTMDAKKVEMERLKAKLASLEAATTAGYSSHPGGRGGLHTWSFRGAKSYSIDNRKNITSPARGTTTTVTDSGTSANQKSETEIKEDASNTEAKEGSEVVVEPKET